MKEGFRQSMAWLHTWSGLFLGWLLYFIFLTGTTGYFDAEIDQWMRPELPMHGAEGRPEDALALGLARLSAIAADAERWVISLPNRNAATELEVRWRTPTGPDESAGVLRKEVPGSVAGQQVEPRKTGGGQLLYQMHYRLHYLNAQQGYWIVGFCAMFMLVTIVTGIIVHKKIFKDFFTFRPAKGQRSWLDAHNVVSVVALPFHVMITYSGLVFFMFTYMPLVLSEADGFAEKDQLAIYDVYEGAYPEKAYLRLPEIPRTGIAMPLVSVSQLLAEAEKHGRGGRVLSVGIRNPGDASARIDIVQERDIPQSGADQRVFDGVSGALLDSQIPARFVSRKVNDVLTGLHEGLFAGPLVRWLYFLSGLMGTAMVATGLIVWTAKRRARQSANAIGLYLVERLNAGTIVGLPIGIACYFWANRGGLNEYVPSLPTTPSSKTL